jgi:hypothetical protein
MPTTKAKKLDPNLLTTEHLHTYAAEVATHLDGWTYRAPKGTSAVDGKNTNTAKLEHTVSGAVVDLYLDSYRGHISAGPSTWVYDRELSEHVGTGSGFERVSVNVSLGRPAATIARELARRGVLESALRARTAIETERTRMHTERGSQRHTVDALNASGVLKRPVHENSKTLAYFHTEAASGSITDGRVRIDMPALSPEQAIAVLRILNG